MHPNRPLQSDSCTYPRASIPHADGAIVDRRYLTTREASAYCGFKTTGALRKALLEGRIRAAGRRGGTGTLMWDREELDRFLRGAPMGAPTTQTAPASTRATAAAAVSAPVAAIRGAPRLESAPSTPPRLFGPVAGELCYSSNPVVRPLPDEETAGALPPPPLPPRRGPGRPRKYPPLPAVANAGDREPCGTIPATPSTGPRGRTAGVIDAPQKPKEPSAKEVTASALERIRMSGRLHHRRG